IPVASRLVQMPARSRSPGIGGVAGSGAGAPTTRPAGLRKPVTSPPPRPPQPPPPPHTTTPGAAAPRPPAAAGEYGAHKDAPPRKRSLHVDRRARGGVVCGVRRLARAQQSLRRDARPVGALAADEFALDQRHAQPALGERAGTVLARRTAADDDDVVIAHNGS